MTVIAEAVAAWFDYVVGPDLQPNPERVNEHLAIVDIGGRTTDVAVFEDGQLDAHRSGTLDNGVLDIAEAVTRAVKDRVASIARLSHRVIASAFRTGIVKVEDGDVDVRNVLSREIRVLVERITVYLRGLHGRSAAPIGRVRFVGGGSRLLGSQLREPFPRADFADEPQMANARGMWKYGHLSEMNATRVPPADDSRVTQTRHAFSR